MLPLDLHVLSLPLAFILSQDQTLHCIISYISSLILTLLILPKELTLLDKLYFLGTCFLYSNQSFQWTSFSFLFGFFVVGLRIVGRSLPSGNSLSPHSPSSKKSKNKLRISQTLRDFPTPVFRLGLQRYYFFLYLQTFFKLFLTFLTYKLPLRSITHWTCGDYTIVTILLNRFLDSLRSLEMTRRATRQDRRRP